MPPGEQTTNGNVDHEELARDKRRIVGKVIWKDMCQENDEKLRESIDDLLDIMPELESREQQIIVKRVIKRLNSAALVNNRLTSFRDSGGD